MQPINVFAKHPLNAELFFINCEVVNNPLEDISYKDEMSQVSLYRMVVFSTVTFDKYNIAAQVTLEMWHDSQVK